MIWTASREATFEHVLRVAMLAGAAGVGLVYGARPRAALSLAAGLAIFGAVAAGVVEAKLLAGDADAFAGSRLSWPINYAPADAALVWLPLPALVAFAAAHPLRPVVRGAFAFAATLALAVGFTAQSRGAAIALAGALLATVLIARDRGRLSLTLLAVVVPVAVLVPRLIGDPAPSAELVRERGQAAVLAAIAAGAIVCVLSMADRRRRFPFGGREPWVALALWSAVIVVAASAFVATSGRPDAWVSSRWDEFTNVDATVAASPSDAAHFGTGASNRYDYWRVAWHTFEDDPIQGVGAGAFSVPWFKSRSIDENVTDAHSWQAAALAETGLVGLLLTGFVLVFPLARIRKARAGSGRWPIAAVALGGAGVYFVLHASVDWLFRIPAIAIPGFVVLGVLASGGGSPEDRCSWAFVSVGLWRSPQPSSLPWRLRRTSRRRRLHGAEPRPRPRARTRSKSWTRQRGSTRSRRSRCCSAPRSCSSTGIAGPRSLLPETRRIVRLTTGQRGPCGPRLREARQLRRKHGSPVSGRRRSIHERCS